MGYARLCCGSLQPSPDTLTRFKGPTSKAREEREGKRDGRGREKEEEGWGERRGSPPPPFQIPRSATAARLDETHWVVHANM